MSLKYFIASALLLGGASASSAQSVGAGVEALQRGDYASAVAIWRQLAEKGDPDAQYDLAQAYRFGRGVPTNLAAAQTWLERAAAQGHLDAETTLGSLLYQNGDRAGGIKWLKKAAEQGEPQALLIYGTALVNGDSVTQDPVLGYAYVSRAAARGLPAARDTLKQLDGVMSVADRKRGLEVAKILAAAVPAPSSAARVIQRKPAQTATAKPMNKAPKATAESAPVSAASGGWRIQLGAFSEKRSAEALYAKLAGKLPGRQPFFVAAGPITRLQVGPFASRAAAAAACSSLKGQACFAVPAK